MTEHSESCPLDHELFGECFHLVTRREVFEFPWCFSHNAPMLGTAEGWICHWAGEPTRDGSSGCQAITVHVRFVGTPFDLTTHPFWKAAK